VILAASILTAAALAAPAQAPPLTGPFGLVAEPGGTLLVADGASGRIVRIDPRTGRRTVFAAGLGRVYDLDFGPGGLYATTGAQVVRFSGRAKREVVVRGLHDPVGLAVDRDGTIYVAEEQTNRVIRFAPGTRARTVIVAAGLDQPLGLALRTDGSLLVADSHHGRIVRVLEDGTLEPVLEGLKLPVNVTAAPGNAVYAVDHVEHGRPGRLVRVGAGGARTTLRTNVRSLTGVAVGRGGVLYVTAFEAPFVGRLTAAGALEPL